VDGDTSHAVQELERLAAEEDETLVNGMRRMDEQSTEETLPNEVSEVWHLVMGVKGDFHEVCESCRALLHFLKTQAYNHFF